MWRCFGLLSGLAYAVFTAAGAFFSDKLGRRRVICGAELVGVVWGLALFPVLNAGTILAYGFALCVTMAIAGIANGAIGAFLPEQFPTRYRYTASGISYQITGVIGCGVAPLLAPVIIDSHGTFAFGIVLAALSAIAAACTFSLNSRTHDSMNWNL